MSSSALKGRADRIFSAVEAGEPVKIPYGSGTLTVSTGEPCSASESARVSAHYRPNASVQLDGFRVTLPPSPYSGIPLKELEFLANRRERDPSRPVSVANELALARRRMARRTASAKLSKLEYGVRQVGFLLQLTQLGQAARAANLVADGLELGSKFADPSTSTRSIFVEAIALGVCISSGGIGCVAAGVVAGVLGGGPR
jgi:hypothetical protein